VQVLENLPVTILQVAAKSELSVNSGVGVLSSYRD